MTQKIKFASERERELVMALRECRKITPERPGMEKAQVRAYAALRAYDGPFEHPLGTSKGT